MKTTILYLSLAVLSSAPAYCDWISIGIPANSSQTLSAAGQSVTITDPNRTGSGTFTLTGTPGASSGAVFARDYGFFAPSLFSEWGANGLNPVNSDHFTVGATASCGVTTCGVQGTWNFGGIAGGVLPAGSDIVIWDLDVFESLSSMTATAVGAVSGNVAWMQFMGQFDGNGAATPIGVNPTLASHYATFATSGTGMLTYSFTVPSINTDIPALHFRTTRDIATLSFEGGTTLGLRGYAFAIRAVPPGSSSVPEPAAWSLAAGIALALFRKRLQPFR